MKKALLFAVLLTISCVGVARADDSPTWLLSSCGEGEGRVSVAWFNPPENIPPFASPFSGFLSIIGNGYGDTEIMTYYGIFSCPLYEGCMYHLWRSGYSIPDRDYYLSAYVVNSAHSAFYVQPEKIYPACNQEEEMFLPMTVR